MRMAGTKEDQYCKQMSIVVEGLRGDAFVVAKDVVGLDNLQQQGDDLVISGLEMLIRNMKTSVFPHTEHEARNCLDSTRNPQAP